MLEEIRQHAKGVKITFLRGNHCDRLKKYLWSEAQELSGLRALRLEELLEFDRLKINYEDKNQILPLQLDISSLDHPDQAQQEG